MAGELKKIIFICNSNIPKQDFYLLLFYLMSSLLYVLFHFHILSKMKFDCTLKSFHDLLHTALDKDGPLLDPNGLY